MQKFSTVIVGAGASGIVAAISAKRCGNSIVICEKMPRIGKKILASGNGRCNLLNEDLSESHYNLSARQLVKSVFTRFGKKPILNFFKELGLETYQDKGRIFPVTNQSASVLSVLETELNRLSIPIELNFDVTNISTQNGSFIVTSKSNKKISCDTVIITGGGRSYPALGSEGGAYKLAEQLGHTIILPVPVAVPLAVKDPLCHLVQGQKIFASARSVIDGKTIREARGELLFTKYGLSGTAVLDISEDISIAMNRDNKKNVMVSINMVPFIKIDSLKDELAKRINKKLTAAELLTGILPNKFGMALSGLLKTRNPDNIAASLKDMCFKVSGTRGWNEAEFTAGGVATDEVVDETLESRLKKRIYFAGEILDVNGARGGYNLAWAWASGFVAGERASCAG